MDFGIQLTQVPLEASIGEAASVNNEHISEDDMQLILTEDLKYIELRSRNTTYVHSTMCHGNDVDAEQVANFIMLPDHDWRFAIQTFKQIDKDSEQFRSVVNYFRFISTFSRVGKGLWKVCFHD